MIRILHITPHLGGGVGRVLLNYLKFVKKDSSFFHETACLDYANGQAKNEAAAYSFVLKEKMAWDIPGLKSMVADADIVLVHWWNHPLLFDFLVRNDLPPCRLAFWSHISGFHPPNVFTEKILNYPDIFVFTTPVSYKAESFLNIDVKDPDRITSVWSTAGVGHVAAVSPVPHDRFNVGYIGTVDYCKLHPGFLDLCARIDIPDVHFFVCGGPSHGQISQAASEKKLNQKMTFTGHVDDIVPYLSKFDVLGYPLAPYHYGTCDQVLAESMAAGVVPVVLQNPMEAYIVQNHKTGLIAQDEPGYVKAIEKLYHDPQLRIELSQKAQQYAKRTFTLDKLNQDWGKVFETLLKSGKAVKKWPHHLSFSKITARDIFLESLGGYADLFWSYSRTRTADGKARWLEKIALLGNLPSFQAATKGSVHHYRYFFPDDPVLALWSDAMANAGKKDYTSL